MDLLSIFHQLEWWLYPSLSNLVVDFKVFQALFSGPCPIIVNNLQMYLKKPHPCFVYNMLWHTTNKQKAAYVLYCFVIFHLGTAIIKNVLNLRDFPIHQEASLSLTLLINLVFWWKCWCNGPYSRWNLFQIFKETFY